MNLLHEYNINKNLLYITEQRVKVMINISVPKVGSTAFCSCASLVQLCVYTVWAKIWVNVTQTLLQLHPHLQVCT